MSWKVLAERIVVDRRWLRVREQRVLLPNGHTIDEFHLIEGPHWTGVLPITADGKVVLVRQYRHGIGRDSLEMPAGVIEPDELPRVAAERELREETGYAADTWHDLGWFSTEPARHGTKAHFFVAANARLVGAPKPEQSEQIEIELYDASELLPLIDAGRILHGVHVGAILLAQRRGLLPGG